jgi:hypothetical protein
MDENRTYGVEDGEDDWHIPDDERNYESAPRDEVPFHIPRD